MHYWSRHLALALALLAAGCGSDDPAFALPANGDSVVGTVQTVHVTTPTRAVELAQRYSVGLSELRRSNPTVRMRGGLIPANSEVTLPTEFILPDVPRRGIVINLAERRLYFFPPDTDERPRRVFRFAAAVGRDEWQTPTGETRIAEKIADAAAENPLGPFALRLGWKKHLIHGTGTPDSIGPRASQGTVRLYAADMAWLFERVQEGTPVRLVDQPFKIGTRGGSLYLESHAPLSAPEIRERVAQRIEALARKHDRRVDYDALKRALSAPTGLPIRVSTS
ncbi:MAG TPA: L,D-transpeptidase family protein [Verrucomicrobiae bacterium]|nr:L,D-transpeptidase family protein [Verrucomicrobiae bacterium]